MVDNSVEEVKAKTDIVTIIGEYVTLKKAGRNFKTVCPFHNEKTPSFVVSPEMQRYKCFGCGVSGDVFTFLEEYEGMDFYESLKLLADRAGVKLKAPSGKRSEKQELYEINALVAKFYHYLLIKHPVGEAAREYLAKQRNVDCETIKAFQIGFAPNDSAIFRSFLLGKKKIKPKMLEKLGIGYARGRNMVDRFRGRVIFPLLDHRSEVIGFAGRIMPQFDTGKIGKYINSPETPLYHKSHHLYGLNVTKGDIKKSREVVVVEGELDLVSIWQAGIKNAVAIKGSAITQEQALLMRRFADKIILALDADTAGDAAARRGITIAEKAGLEIRVAQLGKFKDPDDAVQEDPNAFKKILTDATSVWDFLIDSAVSRHGSSTGADKSRISREVVPVLASINDTIVQAHYVGVAAKKLNVPPEAVSKQVAVYKIDKTKDTPKLEVEVVPEVKTRRDMIEERLLSVAFNNIPDNLLTKDVTADFRTPFAIKVINKYLSYKKKEAHYDLATFSTILPKELYDGFSDVVMQQEVKGGRPVSVDREFEMLVRQLRELDVKEELDQLAMEISKYEENNQKAKLKKAQQKFRAKSEELTKI